jgi:hypothetical protein
MKKTIAIILLSVFCIDMIACDCSIQAFMTNYVNNYNNDDFFFIKGIKMKTEHHGMQIKLIEDIKGNFQENKNILMVWGDSGATCRLDHSAIYNDNDTLYMLLKKTDMAGNFLTPDNEDFEKEEDYMTINCGYSIVKFSNGYITGKITSVANDTSMLLADFPDQSSNLYRSSTKLTNPKFRKGIYLYPNPTVSQLFVELDHNIVLPLRAEIYNIAGRLVLSKDYTESAFTINIYSLNSGMYFIKITDKGRKTLINKFIKL